MRFALKLKGEQTKLMPLGDESEFITQGEEGQDAIADVQTLIEGTDFLFRIRNTGGGGLHKQAHEHGVFVESLGLEVDKSEIKSKWESDISIGWIMNDNTILAVRDAKFMGCVREEDETTERVMIVHDGVPFELWEDNPWNSDKGARVDSLTSLIIPGGRMNAYRVCRHADPLLIEIDDPARIDYDGWVPLVGQFAPSHPKRMGEWLRSFSGVGTRTDSDGKIVFSDKHVGATFLSNYIQGPARWATWNVDPELDLRDMPDTTHKHPSFWPDHPWHDGHDNLHYELGLASLRETLRWHHAGDHWRAVWALFCFSRFAQWSCTSGLVWTDPSRAGNDRLGWQWGEKSGRGKSNTYVGGMPGSFAITTQKLYTLNVIAAQALGYKTYNDSLQLHKDAVLGMGVGDKIYGVREMWWLGKAKLFLHKLGAHFGDENWMPMSEVEAQIDQILATRDPQVGLWPNYQYNPSGLTNVFEQCKLVMFLWTCHHAGIRDLLPELNEIMTELKTRCIYEDGKWVTNIYQFTPDGVAGYVNGGHGRANFPDVTEFTRPYMAACLGSHAYFTDDPESKRLFLKMYDTLGEFADWSPAVTAVQGTALHPLAKNEQDKVIDSFSMAQSKHPNFRVNWHGGMHYSAWWKILSATFMWADTLGVLHQELTK